MRFFTFEWWSGDIDDMDVALEGYADYFESTRPGFPAEVCRFHDQCTLHDSRVQAIRLEMGTGVLEVEALGYALGLDHGQRYQLRYVGVEKFELFGAAEKPLGGPGGLGDLGYDEWLLLPSGKLEHRLLFSTGTEVAVVASSFEYKVASHQWPVV